MGRPRRWGLRVTRSALLLSGARPVKLMRTRDGILDLASSTNARNSSVRSMRFKQSWGVEDILLMRSTVSLVLLAGLLATAVEAQDPAEGWMAYAVGTLQGGQRITSAEARWRVPADPEEGGAFFSPWFGIETSDNLNLIQPVNVRTMWAVWWTPPRSL